MSSSPTVPHCIKTTTAISRYCERCAEHDIASLDNFPNNQCFDQVVVVPAFNESPDFLTRLQHLTERNPATLAIVVINQPDNDSNTQHNGALFSAARNSGRAHWQSDHLMLLKWPNHSHLLLVDRYNAGLRIPRKQGVGLARKIGCDIALALCSKGVVTARFIHTTDADAYLPADYFSQTRHLPDLSAALYPFSHRTQDDALGHATQLYEDSLRYYVRGLQWAGSPYAYHSIGSCIAVSAHHYSLARGFPKRAGGEDFYLLNKLAKLAPLGHTEGTAIELEARRSSRAPFGTGAAVEKILALETPNDFTDYDPRVFIDLAIFLKHLGRLWQHRDRHAKWLASLPTWAQSACEALGIAQLLNHLARQVDSEMQYEQHVHAWFDAFRTLKFVHYLQNHYYPAIPHSQALSRAQALLTTCSNFLADNFVQQR